ncbi:sigma-70 family RNA polymerase sigma factor [Solibacillus silvestris]|uniref:sigma-70 family RNA polymerase sigma factor n=1 Tax=Solibacillus silvestris TaxID=76853 RepID=UPI003F80D52D
MQEAELLIAENEDLIKKVIFKLKIYRDFEEYMQIGRIALWQAMKNFDETKGDFAMFAYMAIKYAIIRELSKSGYVSQHEIVAEEEKLIFNIGQQSFVPSGLEWPEWFFELANEEQFLLTAMFQEDLSLKEIAEKYNIQYETIKKRRQRLFAKVRMMREKKNGREIGEIRKK